jgi:hypothetical protein
MLEPRRIRTGTRGIEFYDQTYLDALKWTGFCDTRSGNALMTREGILGILEDVGFIVETGSSRKTTRAVPPFVRPHAEVVQWTHRTLSKWCENTFA